MQSYYALLLIGHNEKRVAMNRKCEWDEKEMIFEKISREERERESMCASFISRYYWMSGRVINNSTISIGTQCRGNCLPPLSESFNGQQNATKVTF